MTTTLKSPCDTCLSEENCYGPCRIKESWRKAEQILHFIEESGVLSQFYRFVCPSVKSPKLAEKFQELKGMIIKTYGSQEHARN